MTSVFKPLILAATLCLTVAVPLWSQDLPQTVTLVADSVTVERDGVLIAEGGVEIFADGRHMQAERIVYDRDANRLLIEGPITLTEGPDTIILANGAEMDTELRDGLIVGIRIILDQRLQIAAAQGQRQQGRFTDLREAVATSCEVCKPGQPPLWQIQAKRVIHDEERQRIYFQGARFHILNLPVAYLPALSTPEPGVARAQGFLVPSADTSDLFGTGAKVPYFIPFGDHADLTLTPYIADDLNNAYTRTLEYRYRQAFSNGDVAFTGAFSRDSEDEGELRTYLFGNGNFQLPHQIKLEFGLELASDDSYLNDYDYSGSDRLENTLTLTRVVDDSRAVAEVITFNSFRDDEDNDTIPSLAADISYDKRWTLGDNNGFFDASFLAHGHRRDSDENIEGRDSTHLRGLLRWSNEQTVAGGVRLGADVQAQGDFKQINQDNRYEKQQSDLTPGLALTASLPMSKPGANGSSQLIEPIAQLVWTGDYDIDSPNDDSTQPAFDTGNLFGFRRFPGVDRVDEGLRANLAVRWQHLRPEGWTVGLTFGRVLRSAETDLFSVGTGLDGIRSDWLIQVDLDLAKRFTLRSLTLVDDQGNSSLNETRLSYMNTSFDVSAGYVWQEEDADLGQDEALSELTLDATYDINPSWSAALELRRDLLAERSVRSELGLTYRNECVRVDLSGTRRFRNTDGAEPTYSYGITVSFTGFGTSGGSQRQIGHCAG